MTQVEVIAVKPFAARIQGGYKRIHTFTKGSIISGWQHYKIIFERSVCIVPLEYMNDKIIYLSEFKGHVLAENKYFPFITEEEMVL